MKLWKTIILVSFCFFLFHITSIGQSTVSGQVVEKSGSEIIGANIYIEGSYDGSNTDLNGQFEFSTTLVGQQTLVVSYLGFQTKRITKDISEMSKLTISLRESAATLDAVEISASTFKAGDNSKLAVLKPLDMVTTAGSMGDVIAAVQSLPGTQANADDGRLFVRGGDARETKIYIDGMRVFSPYTRTVQGTPSRGRYSPFLFKGVSFSTGGYDAEFGQALSGVLDMSTTDDPKQTETNISLMTVGLAVGHTHKGDKGSLSLSTSYIDLTPYYWLAPTRLQLDSPFRGFSGELVHRYKLGEGLLKNYVAGDWGGVTIGRRNLDSNELETIGIDNRNIYTNSTYNTLLDDKTSYSVGLSLGHNRDEFELDGALIKTKLSGTHIKAQFKTIHSDFVIFNYGAEYIWQQNSIDNFNLQNELNFSSKIARSTPATFGSVDYFFNKNLAVKLGLRYEYNSLINTNEIDPRLTLAYKTGDNAQVSAAFGFFNQEVNPDNLYNSTTLINERATHYLVNYNFKNEKTIFRLEGYYKKYDDLLTFENGFTSPTINDANNGFGRAYGVDLFWRANGLIKYIDMWVSYSWLNNERKYLNYPSVATPNFSTDHNLSLVTKKWFPNLKSSLGVTYSMASGRPYDDPHTRDFMTERSGLFHNLSLSWAYLISQQKILFLSVSNAPRFRNEFGSRFGNELNAQGRFNSELIRPNDDQFFFIGFFITISEDKEKNQLDQL